jgi:HK97 family phage portal protein
MSFWSFFRFQQSAALTTRYGRQLNQPIETIVPAARITGVDGAMQIATVWRAVELIVKTIATLPIMVYDNDEGIRKPARTSNLWQLLHVRPNFRQTPVEFWIAMLMNLVLRGNAYAEIKRDSSGRAISLIVLPADQVQLDVKDNGKDEYIYTIGAETRIIKAANVLHIREMTGGYIGMSRLEYMRTSISESVNAQNSANGLFQSDGRISGVLSPGVPMTPMQWDQLQTRVDELTKSPRQIQVLPGDLKLSQINLTPQDIQLLSTRQFTVQEIGRWLGVPAVLLNQTESTTTLGSSSGEIIESFYKLTIRPLIVGIEQAIEFRVMTAEERNTLSIEFNMDGMLRASLKDRMDIYSKAVQNGIKSRNECRQLENEPPYDGGDEFTVQSNLIRVDKLGEISSAKPPPERPILQ